MAAPGGAGRGPAMQRASTAIPRRLRIGAAQMIFARTLAGNLEKIGRLADQAAAAGVDALLLPECATTGYTHDFGSLSPQALREALRSVAGMAARRKLYLLVGSPVFAGRRLYNAFLVFDRRGRLVHAYAKCQLTEGDRRWFTPGNGLSLFAIDGVPATAILCHERRYPELVRLPVMAGARIVFHPNAGLDDLAVSRAKRGGRDGIPARAFENATYYVFANSVGPQGGGKWSAGDSKVVAPNGSFLKLADHRRETLLVADLDLALATRRYAMDSLRHPRFLAPHWRRILVEMRRRIRATDRQCQRWLAGGKAN